MFNIQLSGIAVCIFLTVSAQAATLPLYVYKDGGDPNNKYIPSGFTGDSSSIEMNDRCEVQPKEGRNCVMFKYSAKPTQGLTWAGVFFTNPANNWGAIDGAVDITGAKKLKFWARGEKGTEAIQFLMGGLSTGPFSDSDSTKSDLIHLTSDWKEYEIDLIGLDLSGIIAGFAWVAKAEDNPEGAVFYLDNIVYMP